MLSLGQIDDDDVVVVVAVHRHRLPVVERAGQTHVLGRVDGGHGRWAVPLEHRGHLPLAEQRLRQRTRLDKSLSRMLQQTK